MNSVFRSIPALLSAGIALVPPAQAALLVYQGFNYGNSAGSLLTVGASDWTTSSDCAPLYTSTSLGYGNLVTTGGSVQTVATWGNGSTKTATQDFPDIDISSKTELWVSMLVQAPTAVTATGSQAAFGFNIKRNAWGGAVNNTLGKAWGNNTALVSSFPGTQNIAAADYATMGTTTMLVVVHLRQNAAGELWANPAIGGNAPAPGTGQALESGGNFTSLNSLSLSFLNQTLAFDELRIGDTFADVTPTAATGPDMPGILYYQGFSYGPKPGALTAFSGSDWTLTGDVAPLYSPRGFTHPIIGGHGGSLFTSDSYGSGGTRRIEQALNVNLAGQSEVWVGMLLAMVNRPAASTYADVTLLVQKETWQSATGFSISKAWSDVSGLRHAGTLISGAEFTEDIERPMQVVYRLAKGYAPEFWVNPSSTPIPGTGQVIGGVVSNLTKLTGCQISFGSMGLHVDEIVVAENYAAITSLLSKPVEPSGAVLIDFGAATLPTTAAGWNNITNNYDTTGVYSLVDSGDGLSSGVTLRLLSGFGGVNTDGVDASIAGFVATAVKDTFYSGGTATPALQLAGFDPATRYAFTFSASRGGVGDARVTRYTLAGTDTAFASLNASNNATQVAVIPNAQPDATGRFTLTVSKDPANTNVSGYFYLGGLKIEPVSTTLIAPLTISGDQYVDPAGQPVRLWGVNAVAFFPNREMAEGYADKLAEMGVNCVRWHHLQRRSLDWNTKSRIAALSTYATDSRTPDALAWDRFDYLNAKLRERGIYIMVSAVFSREYHPGDVAVMPVNGADDAAWSDAMTVMNSSQDYVDPATGAVTPAWQFSIDKRKMLHVFDERVARLSEEFTGELLDHVNPYTGVKYGEDPQVIAVELLNEFSSEYVIDAGNRFVRMESGVNRLAYWNDRLLQKWADHANAHGVTPGDFYNPATTAQRQARSDFLDALDRTYAQRMKTLIASLGYAKPVVFSNLWRGERPLKLNAEENSHIEDHTYSDPFLVNGPDDWIRSLGKSVIAGKPFFIGEINQREGSSYSSVDDPRRTMLPATLSTYAAQQGWSGFAWFAMNHGDSSVDFVGRGQQVSRNRNLGSLINDQMQLDHMKTGSRIFRRGLFARSSSPQTLRVDEPIWQWTYPGLMAAKYSYQPGWQSVNEIRKAFGPKPSGQDTAAFMVSGPSGNPLVSDSGEIRKDTVRKQLTGAVSQAEVFSGNLDAGAPAGLQRLQINATSGFATVMLVTEDKLALGASEHLLLSRTHINASGVDVAGPGLTLLGLKTPSGGKVWRFTADGATQTLTMSGSALVLPSTGDWRQAELKLIMP